MTPKFLPLEVVVHLHKRQIRKYGGSHGIRDHGLLDSALAQPEATFGGQYLHGDLVEMAAAYLFHIASNHPFFDGNKRIAMVSALVFLGANGVEVHATNQEMYELTLAVASSELDKEGVTAALRRYSKPK